MVQLLPPKGMRDFDAVALRKRYYIIQTIKNVLEGFVFEPLETPAMEYSELLTGKYGEEGEQLLFRVLDNGNYEAVAATLTPACNGAALKRFLHAHCEKALRYDLTIPLARFVATNYRRLSFPYRRYQIQPVWRGDRPQKGRYREFYQCDADIIGSDALMNEVELLRIYDAAGTALGIPDWHILINSRKILNALLELMGEQARAHLIISTIDKIDKIGVKKVLEDLDGLLGDVRKTELLRDFFAIQGTNAAQLAQLKNLFKNSISGQEGITELAYIVSFFDAGFRHIPQIRLTLARGLDYYTGMIVEVTTGAASVGSLGGGGRYADLGRVFGLKERLSGVGISFGIDRIYEVMAHLNLFPEDRLHQGLLLAHMGTESEKKIFAYAQDLRVKGLCCMVYPTPDKIGKQIKYAEKKHIPFVAFLGAEEQSKGQVLVKCLDTRQQKIMLQSELCAAALENFQEQ